MKERHNELTMNEEQFSKRVSNSNFPQEMIIKLI